MLLFQYSASAWPKTRRSMSSPTPRPTLRAVPPLRQIIQAGHIAWPVKPRPRESTLKGLVPLGLNKIDWVGRTTRRTWCWVPWQRRTREYTNVLYRQMEFLGLGLCSYLLEVTNLTGCTLNIYVRVHNYLVGIYPSTLFLLLVKLGIFS